MKQINLKVSIALMIIAWGTLCYAQVPPAGKVQPDPDNFILQNPLVNRTAEVTQEISGSSEAYISLYPNPVKERLNIEFNHFPAGAKAQLLIVNNNGMNYFSGEINVSDGVFTREIDVSNLSPGVYSLQVVSPSLLITRNFLKL